MGTYQSSTNTPSVRLTEIPLYGSDRLGMIVPPNNGAFRSVINSEPLLFDRLLDNKRYEYKDHLGNVRVVSNDIKLRAGNSGPFRTKIYNFANYYPFGMQHTGTAGSYDASGDYRYGYNGKEKDDEIKGEANSLDYGARIYDPRVGRWMSVDPLEKDYPSWSSYNYVMDDPINSVDPDGKRVFFVGGANNDKDGWNYISRFKRIWTEEGLEGFMRIDASYGKMGDIRFTDLWRDKTSYGNFYASNEWAVKKATQDILNDLFSNPLKTGEQLNVAGYSYGSIVQAHVALALIKEGKKVDNLILIGSPIPDDSDLMAELKEMENVGKIGKIIRHDIENDMLSNPGCTIE